MERFTTGVGKKMKRLFFLSKFYMCLSQDKQKRRKLRKKGFFVIRIAFFWGIEIFSQPFFTQDSSSQGKHGHVIAPRKPNRQVWLAVSCVSHSFPPIQLPILLWTWSLLLPLCLLSSSLGFSPACLTWCLPCSGLTAMIMDGDPCGSPEPSPTRCSPAFLGESGGLARDHGNKAVLLCLEGPWACFLYVRNPEGRQSENYAFFTWLEFLQLVWRKWLYLLIGDRCLVTGNWKVDC